MRRSTVIYVFCPALVCATAAQAGQPIARIAALDLPGETPQLVQAITEDLAAAGYGVETIGLEALLGMKSDDERRPMLLVLLDAGHLPMAAAPAIEHFARDGGQIIALQSPMWREPLIRTEAGWTDRVSCQRARAGELAEHILFRFEPEDVKDWLISRYPGDAESNRETVADGPAPGTRALHITGNKLVGWDAHFPREVAAPFPAGHMLTIFSAKGAVGTDQLSVEWEEKDGSRWIAVVDLEPHWRQYVLFPEDFRYWESVRARAAGCFRPADARTIRFGVSQSHTPGLTGKAYEIWVGPVGTAAPHPRHEQLRSPGSLPSFDTLSPAYKLFDCHDVASLRTSEDQAFIKPLSFDVPDVIRSPHPRARGAGFDKRRQWRWIPLLEARAKQGASASYSTETPPSVPPWQGGKEEEARTKEEAGTLQSSPPVDKGGQGGVNSAHTHAPTEAPPSVPPCKGGKQEERRTKNMAWRGTPATLLIHADGPFKGGAWASFGIEGPDWYLRPESRQMIRELAARMRTGAFLLDAGTDRFTCFDDQSIRLGARTFAVRHASSPTSLSARITLVDCDNGSVAFEHSWPIRIEPGTIAKVETAWKPATWPASGFMCTAELLADGQTIDCVRHEIHVWRPREPKRYITIEDGHFKLGGRLWRANGINYMPSSGTSSSDYAYFNQYLSAPSYDPGVISRDLAHVRDMGFNSISIFLLRPNMEDGNLLDLLRQAEAADLKVNLALAPTTPMNFQAKNVREMIEAYRLPEHDNVFMIDVDWEPMWGPKEHRARWDKEWAEWIVEHYGSAEAAENDWNCRAPRTAEGGITNPSAEQIDQDGPHRMMVAAYRRFLDTLLYRKYGAATRFIRTIDPHHFVTFRMAYAGDPTYRNAGWLAYDFPYLGAGVDFLAPEAYGRIGDWENIKVGWFEVAYARWATPDKPVLWAEAGFSAWEASRMCASPAALKAQAAFYEDFYRMLIASASDGIFFWYYPGGYRNEERSDYGIINPDGSDRPVTRVIREYSRLFLECPPPKPVDRWIEIDRDARATGLFGIHKANQGAFWRAIEEGRTPGLRTAGTGTTSADCPALAVGNTPMTGANPPKFLDAAFDSVEIRDAEGKIVRVDKGGEVEVRGDQPITATVTIRNLGEAAWLPGRPKQTGAVSLQATGAQVQSVAMPHRVDRHQCVTLADVPLAAAGLKEPTQVRLILQAENRSPFGERFLMTLTP